MFSFSSREKKPTTGKRTKRAARGVRYVCMISAAVRLTARLLYILFAYLHGGIAITFFWCGCSRLPLRLPVPLGCRVLFHHQARCYWQLAARNLGKPNDILPDVVVACCLWHHNTSRMHSGSKAHLSSQQLTNSRFIMMTILLSFRLGIFMISSWRYVDNCITSSVYITPLSYSSCRIQKGRYCSSTKHFKIKTWRVESKNPTLPTTNSLLRIKP